MDIGVALMPNGFMFGVEYYPIDYDHDFAELNIYLFFFVLHFKVYN
jgi:hypothetical protein